MTAFSLKKELNCSFDDALKRVPEALKSEGFGVLTEIDIQSTLKAKLGVDFRRYKILGACNPPLAYEALSSVLEVGLMLPCNVVVYENDLEKATVLAIDPTLTMAAVGEPALVELAAKVKEKLGLVLAKLE
jgi:uncharacterized protein (DUF302 family)